MKINVLLWRVYVGTVGSQVLLVVPWLVTVTLSGFLGTIAARAAVAVLVLGDYCCGNVRPLAVGHRIVDVDVIKGSRVSGFTVKGMMIPKLVYQFFVLTVCAGQCQSRPPLLCLVGQRHPQTACPRT